MDFGAPIVALAYAAGALSTLSPCVVPLLLILVASALAQHRFGLWALAAGPALSFTVAGLFVATIGVSIGIDSTLLHRVAGAILIVFGGVMALPRLQESLAGATSRLSGGGSALLSRVSGRGGAGQFVVGLPAPQFARIRDAVVAPGRRGAAHDVASDGPTERHPVRQPGRAILLYSYESTS